MKQGSQITFKYYLQICRKCTMHIKTILQVSVFSNDEGKRSMKVQTNFENFVKVEIKRGKGVSERLCRN